MTLRARLVTSLSLITAVMTLVAFGAASVIVNRSEERQLDRALRYEAREEADEIANEGQGRELQISDRGGPKADDVGRLTKYAVLYAADGSVIDRTDTFARGAVPRLASLENANDKPFDLDYVDERLRAIVVAIPGSPGSQLLLAASRRDLEKDSDFLVRVMLLMACLSIGSIALVSWRVVRRLMRGHMAITQAAHRIAAGDLRTRVGLTSGDDEVVQLGRDIDEMVERLNRLVEGQMRFVAYAAHELRSPLTVLYGELQLALRRSRTAEEYRTTIEESLQAVQRLNGLAEDLLALARTAIGPAAAQEPAALLQVAEHAVFWVEPLAKQRGVSIESNVALELDVGPSRDIERLLRNLLDNAVRHSPRAGRVWLDARVDARWLQIRVADEGPGVAEGVRERVFEPFYRAVDDPSGAAGSGLGLAIVREIARRHGGEVRVEDGFEGRGASFVVCLALDALGPGSRSGSRPLVSELVTLQDQSLLSQERVD